VADARAAMPATSRGLTSRRTAGDSVRTFPGRMPRAYQTGCRNYEGDRLDRAMQTQSRVVAGGSPCGRTAADRTMAIDLRRPQALCNAGRRSVCRRPADSRHPRQRECLHCASAAARLLARRPCSAGCSSSSSSSSILHSNLLETAETGRRPFVHFVPVGF
jgi:hypothetical protein